METKGLTCKIPLELHQQIKEEQERFGMTMNQYIEMVLREHFTIAGIVDPLDCGEQRNFSAEFYQRYFPRW